MRVPATLHPVGAKDYEATIVDHGLAAASIYRLTLACPELSETLLPGQFLSLAVEGEARQLTRIPLSFVATEPHRGTISLVYAALGPGTRRLAAYALGDRLRVLGPLGHGWELSANTARALLVAGGTGTVPISAAARWYGAHGVVFDCVVGARSKDLHWAVEWLKEHTKGRVIATTDDGSLGERGLALDPALRLLHERPYDRVLVCGPEPLMAAISEQTSRLDIPCQVSLERTMACGFGACSTCAVKTTTGMKGACLAGPVFDAREVIW